jgi:D-galactarolactone isomerase
VAAALARLLAGGNTYVKLSHCYDEDGVTLSDYAPLAMQLIAQAPDRMLWATDWPHATQDTKPDGAALFDALAAWAPDAALRRRILVQNPEALYWRD